MLWELRRGAGTHRCPKACGRAGGAPAVGLDGPSPALELWQLPWSFSWAWEKCCCCSHGLPHHREQPCSIVRFLVLHSPHLPLAGPVRLWPHPPGLCDHLVRPELPWRVGSDRGDPEGSRVTLGGGQDAGQGQDCQGPSGGWWERQHSGNQGRVFRKGRTVGFKGKVLV